MVLPKVQEHEDAEESKPKEPKASSTSSPKATKLWRWSEKYQYSLPRPNGDHWDIILERLLEKDKFQCDAWKDEVQNLLIFAGLFSAVVTGFAVESYQQLQPDPNADLVALLSRIATSVDTALSNGNASTSPSENMQSTPPFSPSRSAIHINVFWFSSLILSLTTVVVGIVSLQWLREHQRYTEPLGSRQALAIFHLRAASLKRWHVPHIFSSLPLLLQAAVILFFVGLIEFLLSLNNTVAIPAIFLISLSILFVIGTTMLPTLQIFTAGFITTTGKSIPSQCPYKSPQSWVFRHLCLFMIRVPTLMYQHLTGIHWPAQIKFVSRKVNNTVSWAYVSIFRSCIPVNWKAEYTHQHWIDLDISWLILRDQHFLYQQGEAVDFTQYGIEPTYDLVHGLVSLAKEHSVHEDVVFSAYHACKELCNTLIDDKEVKNDLDDTTLESLTRARVAILQSCFSPFRSVYFKREGVKLRVVRDETLLLFLISPGIREHSSLRDHVAGIHKMELITRMLVYNFRRGEHPVAITEHETDPLYWHIFAENHADRLWEIPVPFLEEMIKQHYMLLEQIFDQAYSVTSGDTLASVAITGYSILLNYFQYISWFRPTESLESSYLSVLRTISAGLNFSLNSHGYDKADLLFFCSRLYMERVAHRLWFFDAMQFGSYTLRANILDVLETMLRYEQQLDKVAYVRSENLWRSELHPLMSKRQTVVKKYMPGPIISYQPIPEVLLRFVPYQDRAPVVPTDLIWGTRSYERVASVGGGNIYPVGEMLFNTWDSRSPSAMSGEGSPGALNFGHGT